MFILLSPKPSDGPLNGQDQSAQITVVMPTAGRVVGALVIPGRPTIEVPVQLLAPGTNRVVVPLPPGGTPPTAQLRLLVRGIDGSATVATYTFQ